MTMLGKVVAAIKNNPHGPRGPEGLDLALGICNELRIDPRVLERLRWAADNGETVTPGESVHGQLVQSPSVAVYAADLAHLLKALGEL